MVARPVTAREAALVRACEYGYYFVLGEDWRGTTVVQVPVGRTVWLH